MEVQIWKAHATPNMLSPKMEAVGAAGPSGAGSADRLVDRQTIYVVESAEGEAPQEVMPEDRRKSYRFGGDLVPLSSVRGAQLGVSTPVARVRGWRRDENPCPVPRCRRWRGCSSSTRRMLRETLVPRYVPSSQRLARREVSDQRRLGDP